MDGRSLRNAAKRDVIASRASDAPGLGLPRACRLLRRVEYDAVYKVGRRRSSREFTIFVRPNGLDFSRFGWSIKKALGGAVQRNRIRRRIREIVRLHRQEIAPGWDIVIHPRSSAITAEFSTLSTDLLKTLPHSQVSPPNAEQ